MRIIFVAVLVLTIGLCSEAVEQSPILDVLNYIETTRQKGCEVSQLSSTIAWCNGTLTEQNTLPEYTLCQSYKPDVDDIICVQHNWMKLKDVERYSGRTKRSIIDILIHIQKPCDFFCDITVNESLITHPPLFESCPSSLVLYPELGQTYVLHIWQDPIANDTDGRVISLEQIVGPIKNASLQGSVSPGTDYVVSYIATDDDNLKWVCAFTITSEIPACPPIVHIENGVTACSDYNFRASTCNITCDIGYYLNTTYSSVTCQENGNWSEQIDLAQCLTVTCTDDPSNLGNFTNMEFVCEQNADQYDVICWSVCLSGYTLRNDQAEDDIIAELQAAVDNAVAAHNITSIETQEARDAADQALVDLDSAIDIFNSYLNSSEEAIQLLNDENQILTDQNQQLTILQTNLTITQHNLTEAIASNDPIAADLQDIVIKLENEISVLTENIDDQTILVYNLTEDVNAANAALQDAQLAVTNAELLVNETETNATLKEAEEQQALAAITMATLAYNDAVLFSEMDDKVITSYARCLPSGTWHIPGEPYCTDITQPEIYCVPMVLQYLNKDQMEVVVSWSLPTATDNSGNVRVVHMSGIQPGSSLTAGQYRAVYQAIDNDENRSPLCNMLINVEEYYCSNVTTLVNDTNMNYACDGYKYGSTCNVSCDFGYDLSEQSSFMSELNNVMCREYYCSNVTTLVNDTNMNYVCNGYKYGSTCNVSCDFGYDLVGQSSFTCELNTTTGEVVTYWTWDYPKCIEVVCQLPDAPENGQIDCTDYVERDNTTIGNGTASGNSTGTNTIGITCTVICDTGYILPYNTEYVYTCENATGWSSVDFPAMCIAAGTEQEASYTLQISYFTADTCINEDILGFQTDLVAIFGQEVTSYPACTMGYKCTMGNVISNCTNDVNAVDFIVIVSCDDPPNDEGCDLSVDLMSSLESSINSSVQNGALNSVGVTRTQDWLAPISSDLPQCMTGSVLVGKYCEQCAPGYFYIPSSDECRQCGFGAFNNQAGRTFCTTCPGDTSTKNRGVTSENECIDECSPGSYSPDGLQPCLLCETGFYQDSLGATDCNAACPSDTWTSLPGANSSQDCIAYDIFFVDIEPNFFVTTVGDQMSLVFWFLNHQQPDISIGVFYNEDDSDDYAFTFKTESNAQLLFNGGDNEPTDIVIEPSVWTMIGITWNWSSKTLTIYKDGEEGYSTTLNAGIALPEKLVMSANAGTVLAGFSLTNTVVGSTEMLQSSLDCTHKLTGSVFSMDNLASLRRPNMKYVPTICAESNATIINHCDFNACQNGAVCVHNDTAGYTCNCTQEYGGPFCEEFLVHGGWSEWIFSTACTVTCGNGTQERFRLCDNPPRSNYGDDCEGNKTEIVDCLLQPCQECELPGNEGGGSCDLQDDVCTPVCPSGYVIPAGQSGQNYACGYTTNYEWLPLPDLPICTEIKKPTEYNCSLTFNLNRDVPCSIADDLALYFQTIADTLHCEINNVHCTITVDITGCTGSRKRRQSTVDSKLVVFIAVPITNTDPMNFTAFYLNSAIDASIQEIVDALTDIETTVTEVQNNASILSVNYVDGNLYTVVVTDPTVDIIIATSIGCTEGQVPTNGACAECQKGTYQIGEYCIYCERGTYQADPSQTSCMPCPQGYTTINIGARAASECYEIPVPPIPPDYTPIIIGVACAILVIVLVLAILYCSRRIYLLKKFREKFDMEADEISLYTDFPDIAYNVYFKRRQVLGFDEDGFPIISKEPVKNGDIPQWSDAESETEDYRTPTPLPKREPFAYPTDYVDPPFTYDPYRNIDTEILLPEGVEHVFDFPALKESVRYRVPGRKHLQNAYPLQQFGVKGKAKSRHRKHLPYPDKVSLPKKLPQLMYRPQKDEVSLEEAFREQKRLQARERDREISPRETSPRDEFDYEITPHDHKAPKTAKMHKAKSSLAMAIEKRSPRGKEVSPRSPKSPRFTAKKGKPGSRGSSRSLKPSKRYQSILETSPRPTASASTRPATSASSRSLKSAMSTRSRSTRADSPRSVSIQIPTLDIDLEDDIPHPKPSRIMVPKLNLHAPPKSMLKTSTTTDRPATGHQSVKFKDDEDLNRPPTSKSRKEDGAPSSASSAARATIVDPNASRHKSPYKPFESEVVETYRPDSVIYRPDSPLYRPVSSSTRASSPTFHPRPVLHEGVTVQRRSDFIMFNPPTNLKFNVSVPPSEHHMKQMKPPPFFSNKVKHRDSRKVSPRVSQMSVRFDDSDDEIFGSASFFMTEIPESPIPSRGSMTSRASYTSRGSQPVRPRRASKVRFKKESPPPAYQDAISRDPVIESARDSMPR